MKSTIYNSVWEYCFIKLFQGINKVFDLQEGIFCNHFRQISFLYKTFSEKKRILSIVPLVKKNSVVLDIGANIGFFSIYLSKHAQAKIIAFEPEERNFKQLCGAINSHKLTNTITPVQYAVSDTTGTSNFYISSLSPMDHKLINSRSCQVIKLPSITCDDFFSIPENKLFQLISLIKIDVQGAELMVISGMHTTLQKNNYPPIMIEYAPSDLHAAQETPESFFYTFEQMNYFPYDIHKKSFIDSNIFYTESRKAHIDLLMIHKHTSSIPKNELIDEEVSL